jgi:hypothetical protein
MSSDHLPEPRLTRVYRLEVTLGQPLDLGERPQLHAADRYAGSVSPRLPA